MVICNICGNNSFEKFVARENALCSNCHSLERTRGLGYILDKLELPKKGDRILHLAPERAIGHKLIAEVGQENYEAYDLHPERYDHSLGTKFIDLTEADKLESERYDLIIHNHVLEHLPCYVTPVLWHLHRSLKQTGHHIFSVPCFTRKAESDFNDISDDERTRRFGQKDHVRSFGLDDKHMTIGKIFKISEKSHRLSVPEAVAKKHNISAGEIYLTMFVFEKDDLLLTL